MLFLAFKQDRQKRPSAPFLSAVKSLPTTVMLMLLLCVAWLVGCVDVSSTGPDAPVINSEFRFLNAAGDLGDVNITLDLGNAVSSLAVGATNTHQTYPSGNRLAVLSNGDSLRIAMTAEQRATVMILPLSAPDATREFIKLVERRIFDSADVPAVDVTIPINDTSGVNHGDTTFSAATVGKLRFVNGVLGATYDISIQGQNTDLGGGNLIEALWAEAAQEFRDVSGYLNLPVGDYTVTVTSSADGSAVASEAVSVNSIRRTMVLMPSGGGVSVVSLEDN